MADEQEVITRLLITPAALIKPVKQRWLVEIDGQGVIPLGTSAILAGEGGAAKSTWSLYNIAKLTRGELEGDLYGQKRNVIIFGPEDDWATVMVPRLLGASADLDYIYKVEAETVTDTFTQQRELKFPLDMGMLKEAVNELNPAIIMIDPAPSLMEGDMNKAQEVRRSFEPLQALAQEKQFSIILINHFGKAAGSARSKLSGSHAWRDLTRCYLAFATDEETGERIISQDKNNYGTGLGSWKFVLDSVDVPVGEDGETTSVGKVRFLGASDVSVNEIIKRESFNSGDEDDRNEAEAFILNFLYDSPGYEAKAGDIIKVGKAEGFSQPELKDARRRAKNPKIITHRAPGQRGGWIWQIDSESGEPSLQGGKL